MPVVVINDDSSDDDEFKLPSLLQRVASPVKVRFDVGISRVYTARARRGTKRLTDTSACTFLNFLTAKTTNDAWERKPADTAETGHRDASED
jgi:hypothetical protein